MTEPTELAAAILTRLGAIEDLAVLDGKVDTTPDGAYAVFYDDTPRLGRVGLAGTQAKLRYSWRIVCAGRDANEVRWVVQQVIDALIGQRLTADRSTGRVELADTDAPILRDDSVPADIRFSQTLPFHTTARRAP